MSEITYLTKEGMENLKKELEQLEKVERPAISRQISEARDKGDLSENAEYDAAKDAQGLLEAKISKLKNILGNARLIEGSKLDSSKVSLMCKVKLKNIKFNKEVVYTIVSETEANLKEGKISIKSAIGAGLLGHKVGDHVKIQVPAGLVEFEILDISL